MNFDLIVVGGGISGSIAAISASRNGIRTLLIDQYGYLGGMLTVAGVGPMMTFHYKDKQIIQGITAELIDRLVDKGKSPGHIKDTIGYTYTVTPFDNEAMKHELEKMLLESGGKILYHTMLAEVKKGNDKIESIIICNKEGLSELEADVYIDATGDGDLSAWAGVDFIKGRKSDGLSQPMTMILKMRNVDIKRLKKFIKNNPDEFPAMKTKPDLLAKVPRLSLGGFSKIWKKAQDEGEITFSREDILFFETNNPGEVIINTTRVLGCDSTDPWSLSKAEIEGRKQVRELQQLLKEKIVGFENAITINSGPFIGIRSSRQIKGVYQLDEDDILSGKKFKDVIAHSAYPIDIHCPEGENNNVYEDIDISRGKKYSIPYRTLINKAVTNLITVGRCISTTFSAQGAIRTSPTVGAIGHAGGAAASLAIKNNISVNEINVTNLQQLLIKQNAYLEI